VLLKREKKRKDRRKEIGEGGYDKNMVLLWIFFHNSKVHALTKVELVKEL
jgi:hypothetical protein